MIAHMLTHPFAVVGRPGGAGCRGMGLNIDSPAYGPWGIVQGALSDSAQRRVAAAFHRSACLGVEISSRMSLLVRGRQEKGRQWHGLPPSTAARAACVSEVRRARTDRRRCMDCGRCVGWDDAGVLDRVGSGRRFGQSNLPHQSPWLVQSEKMRHEPMISSRAEL